MNNTYPGLTETQREIENHRKILTQYYKHQEKNGNQGVTKRVSSRIESFKSRLAWFLLEAGEYREGLRLYRELSWKTYGEEKYIGISRALIELGEYHEADRLLARGLNRFPESGALLVARGLLYRRLGDEFKALKNFQGALALIPDDSHALYDKAISLNALGYYNEAAAILKYFVEKYPDDPEYLIEMGYSLIEQGYPRDAAENYLKAKDMVFESPALYGGLYCAYMDQGMKDEALEIATEGLQKLPDEHPGLYANLGEIYREMGWRDDAIETLSKGLEKFPDDGDLKELLREIEDEDNDPDINKKLRVTGLFMLFSELLKKLSRSRP
ncbi:MAG: tetratricopeptide repeat protein [Candidatus Mariimomonas ferrooxydans]